MPDTFTNEEMAQACDEVAASSWSQCGPDEMTWAVQNSNNPMAKQLIELARKRRLLRGAAAKLRSLKETNDADR